MIESFLLNEAALKAMCLEPENEVIEKNMPSDEEFDFLYDFHRLLKPLKELTEFLSGSKYITTSILHPSLFKLINYTYPQLKL
ncbi:zinc finger BED domain-containing 4-like [Brachionus plicatilis]|uniref:Zinc finger BED domain-containing 4-like n=1 Tax=Brachionus plicatilis TaxID=10195 RepID=A0A3M7SKM5_BRAPC|nr:zinc finger BED domain-containing 4-like [Brachionus plicatilis]